MRDAMSTYYRHAQLSVSLCVHVPFAGCVLPLAEPSGEPMTGSINTKSTNWSFMR
jgi:hypothetical protein